jgi:leucyl-tRNA synthetase
MSKSDSFDHNKIEAKWQARWAKEGIYSPDIKESKKKFYNLWMFPYPSGEGLHAGHAFSSTGSDIYGRFMRMQGKSVFQPIGYDSFGIHSENYALKVNKQPRELLEKTTRHYEEQLRRIGHGYDWTKAVTTSDPNYYKWTQWLFVQLFRAGLVKRAVSKVNWCPSCKTVVADEQVIEGKCERCKSLVEKKDLMQWHIRITDYAEKLLSNLEKIDWPDKIKLAQRNWIGKKEGITIHYQIDGSKEEIACWTSRPDTNFGATFVVVSPEHPLVTKITTRENTQKVTEYIKDAQNKSYEERVNEGKVKSGIPTGAYAINQLTGKKMPIWVSNFVIMGVGTGAVVGVPGHDLRDFEFAKKFDLPIKRVVVGSDGDKSEITNAEQVQEAGGTMVNSDFLNGLDIHEATVKIMDYIEEKGWGKRETNYHLRDWLISRQRYWGPPIPAIYCEACAKKGESYFSKNKPLIREDQTDWECAGWYPVSEETLPVELPLIDDYKPKGDGSGPLANHPEFYETICPGCGAKAKRETDVSDTFLDSSWYFLRYPSMGALDASDNAFNSTITKDWLPVDLYFGGAEHAVLHLMYARFITMALKDMGLIDFEEPFPRFFAHGLMIKDGAKMSKSRGNVVNPDGYITKYGADALRLYFMFMGPVDGYPDFRDTGIEGMSRFVDRLWRILNMQKDINDQEVCVKMHQTIKKVSEDTKHFRYNTAIAGIMEFVNLLYEKAENAREGSSKLWQEVLTNLTLMLAPFAPHLAEEVWVEILAKPFTVHTSTWPKYDEKLTIEDKVTVVIQVNGKLRGQLLVNRVDAANQSEIEKLAKSDTKVNSWIQNNSVRKVVFVAGKLINFVLG